MLDNYSCSIPLKVHTLKGTNTIVEESQKEILDLIVTKELKKSPSSLLEDMSSWIHVIKALKEPYEDPYYRDVINDHSKLLIQKMICQVGFNTIEVNGKIFISQM